MNAILNLRVNTEFHMKLLLAACQAKHSISKPLRGSAKPACSFYQEPARLASWHADCPVYFICAHGTWAGLEEKHISVSQQGELWQVEPSVSDVGSGWYLDRIEVMSPEGAVWRFPCHNWLGKSDAGDHRGACPEWVAVYIVATFVRRLHGCVLLCRCQWTSRYCLQLGVCVCAQLCPCANQVIVRGSWHAGFKPRHSIHSHRSRLSAAAPAAERGRRSRRRAPRGRRRAARKAAGRGDGRGRAAAPREGRSGRARRQQAPRGLGRRGRLFLCCWQVRRPRVPGTDAGEPSRWLSRLALLRAVVC